MDRPPPLVNAVYYPSWRVYKDIPPSSLRLDKISTIFYAFAIPQPDGSLGFLDEYADAQIDVDAEHGCLDALAGVKRDNPHVRTVLSIGGGAGSGAFAQIASTATGRTAFAQAARAWVHRYSFDGIDIDWEHPASPAEGRDYVLLLQACRAVLPSPQYLLATALPVDPSVLGRLDVRGVAALVDHINLMCYDFAGPWSTSAGHHAQLLAPPHLPSAQSGVQYLLDRGVPPQRILLGIPAYARVFWDARYEGDSFQKGATDDDDDDEKEETEMDYRDVPTEWKQQGVLHVDPSRAAAWAVVPRRRDKVSGSAFVSMDVPATVRAKAEFVRRAGLGGLFYWTGAGDAVETDESLVAAGFDALHGY
ncbi:chitinase [Sporothrix schenckii 1099-18]|uniref:chitinase n=1 Tax=Sporothrix schenckii 1099-18 TaxID=1397361 RepID=A0A0F2MJU5_SPOSC|nr:chitinase [Sporothrix schenckii 1099-18]KJR89349.1 chitinase [Sporothrix schenckii 1099-18]